MKDKYDPGDTVYWTDDDPRTPNLIRIRRANFLRYEGDKAMIGVEDTVFCVDASKIYTRMLVS